MRNINLHYGNERCELVPKPIGWHQSAPAQDLRLTPTRVNETRLLESLLTAAMRACDHHGDGRKAREQMKRDCLATPVHLRADLLAHFRQTYEDDP
jgi:hypothetical protein